MKKVILIAFLILLSVNGFAEIYSNPENISFDWDDELSNTFFDIKSDKHTYTGLSREIVYFEITNLTDSIRNFDLGLFSSEEIEINFVGEWKELSRQIPVYDSVQITHYIPIADLNVGWDCSDSPYQDYNLTHCQNQIIENIENGTTTQYYMSWKKTKAQSWQNLTPNHVPNGFFSKGGLRGINIGKNETKYFMIIFTHKIGVKGEFYACANTDCLDPFFDPPNFPQRASINIGGSHSEIIANQKTIIWQNVDTSAFLCAGDQDANKIALVTEATSTEIDMIAVGNCGFDMNFFWQSDTDIPEDGELNASDTNGFRFYITENARPTPMRDPDNVTIDSSNVNIIDMWDIDANFQVFDLNTVEGRKGVENLTTSRLASTTDKEFWTSQSYTGSAYANNNVGSNNPVVLTNETSLGADIAEGTFEFWFYINDTLATMKRILFWGDAGTGDNSGRGEIWTKSTSNKLTMSLDADQAGGGWSDTEQTGTISANTWHHFAFTWEANSQKMYVDNVEVASDTQNVIYDLDVGSLQFGGRTNDQSFNIIVDDIIFWDEARITFRPNHLATQPTINLGAVESIDQDSNITFNVFQGTGTQFDLTNFDIDFNVDFYDRLSADSPITIPDINNGSYLVTITKDGWTDGNTFVLIVSDDTNVTKTIDKFVYPQMLLFERDAPFSSTSTIYQTIETFQYNTAFGSSTAIDVGCSFTVATTNASSREVDFLLQTSDDAVIWTDQQETPRTFDAITLAGSIYMQTLDFNVSDGNHFFRVQQKRDIGAGFTITTDNLVCRGIIHRDQNNLLISDFDNEVTNASTTNTAFENINSFPFITPAFNGFVFGYGDIIYSYGATGGKGTMKWGIQEIPDSNGSEYPRTVGASSSGVGGQTTIFEDLNRSTSYTIDTFAKTTAGTFTSDFSYLSKYLNQRPGDFAQGSLNALTVNTSNFEIIKEFDLNLSDTEGDFSVLAVIPISCDEIDCLFEAKLQMVDTTYDINSLVVSRETNGAGTIGVVILQYIFEDVNSTDMTLKLWANTDAGTITFQGGNLTIIRANASPVLLPNPPQIPDINAPVNGSIVSGGAVDFNCFSTDPNGDTIVFDVNVIFRDTNTTAIELESGGDGVGNFNSLTVDNGEYSISCVVRETGTFELFSAEFDNSGYSFSIANPSTPTITVNSPNGGELFNSEMVSTVDINFSINDIGSISWLIDANFSVSASQGTGTVIVNDQNTAEAGIICIGSNGIFDCILTWNISSVPAGDYFILISATDSDGLTGFDSSDAIFTITISPPGEDYIRYFNPLDDRKDLTDQNKFVNPELVGNESGVLKNSEEQNLLLMGIIILLVVLIIIVIFVVFIKKGKR